jgi:hypothetical protein
MTKSIWKDPAYLIAVLMLGISGCTQPALIKNMQLVSSPSETAGREEGKARVVFMRPSGGASGIQSSVFELKDNNPELIGIVAAGTKVACHLAPGRHLFMVLGQDADFMAAEVLPNKTYYVIVAPSIGWTARFSLRPVHKQELDTAWLEKSLRRCVWVEKTPDSDRWAFHNLKSIQFKQIASYEKWQSQPTVLRADLHDDDGR